MPSFCDYIEINVKKHVPKSNLINKKNNYMKKRKNISKNEVLRFETK